MPLCNGRQRNGPMDVTYSDIRDGDERKPATRRQAHAWLPSWCWFTVSVRSLSSTDSRISTPLLYHSQNPRHPDGLRPFLGGQAGGFDFYIERLVCLVRCHLDACTKKRNVDGRMRACRTIDIDAQNTTGQEVVAPLAFGVSFLANRVHGGKALVLGHVQRVHGRYVVLRVAIHTRSAQEHGQHCQHKAPALSRRLAASASQHGAAGQLQSHDGISCRASAVAAWGTRVARILSMVFPSISTTSSFQPSHSTVSVTLGNVPVSSMIMPLSVW